MVKTRTEEVRPASPPFRTTARKQGDTALCSNGLESGRIRGPQASASLKRAKRLTGGAAEIGIRGPQASASLKRRQRERGEVGPRCIRGPQASASLKQGDPLRAEHPGAGHPRPPSLGLIEACEMTDPKIDGRPGIRGPQA